MPQKWLWFSNYFFIPELFHCQNFSKTIAIWNKFWLCMKLLIAARQGGFIVPYVWEIVVRKNLTNFEGCHFARFYILIWWSFSKIETKNFNSGPCFFKLVKLGTILPDAHFLNCVHIGRSQTIAAIICGLFFGKTLRKVKRSFLRFLNYKYRKKLSRDVLEIRYWSLFVLLFLLSYARIL